MAIACHLSISSSPVQRAAAASSFASHKNVVSSSPGLPSPSQILISKSVGENAANPNNKTGSLEFTKASSFLRSTKSDQPVSSTTCKPASASKSTSAQQDVTLEKDQGKEPEARISRKASSIRKSGPRSTTKTIPKFSTARSVNDTSANAAGVKEKTTKQLRKEDQSTISKARITKPGARRTASKRSKTAEPKVAGDAPDGRDPPKDQITKAEEASPPRPSKEDLGLAEALKRRREWTPAKKTAHTADRLDEVESAWSALIPYESPPNGRSPGAGFGKFTDGFGYTNIENPIGDKCYASSGLGEETSTKRLKLDVSYCGVPLITWQAGLLISLLCQLVNGISLPNTKSLPVKKSRSSNKKPPTITEKATAPFIPNGHVAPSIRSYFGAPSVGKDSPYFDHVSAAVGSDGQIGKEGNASRKLIRTGKKKTRTSKAIKQPTILLSPDSAIKMVNEQDLLFGTSSQLAREESPTFLRNLQQAVKESEITDDLYSSYRGHESQISVQSTTSSSKLPAASRNLWTAAARDIAGSLLDVEVVDLIDTPQPSRTNTTAADEIKAPAEVEKQSRSADDATNEERRAVEDTSKREPAMSLAVDMGDDESMLPRSVAEAALRERPKSRSPVKKSKQRKTSKASETDTMPPGMPNYSGFTTIDLNKAVAAFGFKPMRRREELIALLETCWKSKSRIALQSLPPNVSRTTASNQDCGEETSSLGSSIKSRGRPPKKTTAETDSNGAKENSIVSPKKPRGRPRKTTVAKSSVSQTSAIYLPLQPTLSKPSQQTAPTSICLPVKNASGDLKDLLPMITKAITSYPPTHDPKDLSWYEKILLYDPVVLEDLADWLNATGLGLVDCGEKVSPATVKQWCESQSVCCLWKENLRGGKRARY
ncbi:MAG: hypothetical protein Q9219_007515 [cf. Caloplaca sp. 3 TL-2023]